MTTPPPKLSFSEKYDRDHARAYEKKHRTGLRRRLTTWREIQLARRALHAAGDPASVLDMPCGAGRFWPMLAEHPTRRLLAGDRSPAMLEAARAAAAPALLARFESVRELDAFALDLPDDAVEHILCMRLLHHIARPQDRLRLLRELHRVASRGVTVSLWVDGNLQAWRRRRLDARRRRADVNRVVVPRATIEAEFAQAGFRVRRHFDVLPGWSMWRFYLLDKV
ncbi:class I SAM-dependent methyltransferase [Immundisolibacter sp.]|uniref:class I SAM-dependent methyltransferase n=1 Tax=Immundisolibacter sp. TaxID=1934948 RepID=UPI002629B219|nr:class I SAM-dependent methyltransferase [Immundisolibacter sp.]MDD3650889.1 class I SAM-dependent methyltransferase [Immundisolibacter sp.]